MSTALQSFRLTLRSFQNASPRPLLATLPIDRRRRLFSSTPPSLKVSPQVEELLQAPDATAIEEEFEEALRYAGQSYDTPRSTKPKKLKPTFLNMGDPQPFEKDDPNEDDDDIQTLGHIELEQVREIRHYNRLAAWEMPMLSKLAKPFVPPEADTPLRFRYTTYMGEQHPAEKKVVLEFCAEDMPNLTDLQKMKLRKLVGVRLNPETDVIKISCEMFPSQAQNKRYLGDLVDKLLVEARDPTDTFEDVPLDTRHHVFKRKPKMPVEWRLTEERVAELEAYRREIEMKDMQKEVTGQIVDGVRLIEEALKKPQLVREALPEMVRAGKAVKGKRVAMRR